MMWGELAKIAVRVLPPDKLGKIALVVAIAGLVFILLLIAIPLVIISHLPIGQSADEYNYYISAANQIEYETGVNIGWQKIMAIDAVLLEQDYSQSNFERAYGYKNYFIYDEEVEDVTTVYCNQECVDPSGNTYNEDYLVSACTLQSSTSGSKEYECVERYYVYYERDYDEVLSLLVADGILQPEQVEDVKRYTIYDASPLAGISNGLPDHWKPVIYTYLWPVEDHFKVTSLFGWRIDPIDFEESMHNGIDIAAERGTPVISIDDGKVTFANYMGNAGKAVVIDHGNSRESRYYHLDTIQVLQGQKIEKGQVIGTVGNTGRTTGYHLHFEIRIEQKHVDPLQFYR